MYQFSNVIIYLIGFPGTGKLTIAKEIIKQANIKLVDNHLINNPILSVLEIDRKTKIPIEIWAKIREVKEIIFDTILNYTPENANFIFTNYLTAEDAPSQKSYDKIESLAKKRNSFFLPIRLLCEVEELKKRIISPERLESLKMYDDEAIVNITKEYQVFYPNHSNNFNLDVTYLTPKQAAIIILDKLQEKINN